MPDNKQVAAIVTAIDAFERALSVAQPADASAFGKRRIDLARAADAFLAGERQGLADPIHLLVGNVTQAERQRLFKAFVDLRLTYSAHIARWNNRTIAADWPGYRTECLALIASMRALLGERRRSLRAA